MIKTTAKTKPKASQKASAAMLESLRERLADWETMSRGEVAALMGLSVGRVSQLVTEGILSQDPSGRFLRRETVKAIVDHFRDRGDLDGLKAEKLSRETELLDLQIARAKNDYLPRLEIEKYWQDLILICRTQLLSLGNRVSPRLIFCKGEAEMEREINGEIEQALTTLSRSIGHQEDQQKQIEVEASHAQ